jgi:BASS family bile acid:Na+ symporter
MTPVIDLAIWLTLWSTGVYLGASHRPAEILAASRRPALYARIAVLDLVGIPLLVWVITVLAGVPAGFATGLLLVGAASAGPLGLKLATVARGDTALAIGLVVALELANLVAIPIWAAVLLPAGVDAPVGAMVRTLALGVVAPIVLGSILATVAPTWAARLAPALDRLSTLGLLVVITGVVLRDWPIVLEAAAAGVQIVAAASVLGALAAGWWIGGPSRSVRVTTALVSAVRANVPALAVASAAFGASAEPTVAIVVFGVVSVVVAPAAAVLLRRLTTEVGAEQAGLTTAGSG